MGWLQINDAKIGKIQSSHTLQASVEFLRIQVALAKRPGTYLSKHPEIGRAHV